jgi:DNA-binding CsgD family transcriptional regulator
MGADILSVIESAYQMEADLSGWLSGILDASSSELEAGRGMCAYLYDASSGQPRIQAFAAKNTAIQRDHVERCMMSSPARVGRKVLGSMCATATEIAGPSFDTSPTGQMLAGLGIADFLLVNGLDPTGHGFWLGTLLPQATKLGARKRASWSRVAAHLAASYRLRRKLDRLGFLDRPVKGAEAILTADGKVAHAELAATSRVSQRVLRAGAAAIDRARGRLRKTDPEQAVAEWKGLIAARWTLLDHFESDGKRFLLACENQASADRLISLSPRERQALSYASLGHTNKLIAYEMGIAASTVGVLLYRAGQKLRVGSREELIAAYRAHALAG